MQALHFSSMVIGACVGSDVAGGWGSGDGFVGRWASEDGLPVERRSGFVYVPVSRPKTCGREMRPQKERRWEKPGRAGRSEATAVGVAGGPICRARPGRIGCCWVFELFGVARHERFRPLFVGGTDAPDEGGSIRRARAGGFEERDRAGYCCRSVAEAGAGVSDMSGVSAMG